MKVTIGGTIYSVTDEQAEEAVLIVHEFSINGLKGSILKRARKLIGGLQEPGKPTGRPPEHADKASEVKRLRAEGFTWAEIVSQLGISLSAAIRLGKSQ